MDDAKLQANAVTLRKGEILGDQTTTTAVQYLDLSDLFSSGDRPVWVRVWCSVDMYAVPVESATPATTPTITAITGDAAMDFFPAGQVEHWVLEQSDPFLAYSADGGILRVRRASPPAIGA